MTTFARFIAALAITTVAASALHAQVKPQGQPVAKKPASTSAVVRSAVRKALDAYSHAAMGGDTKGMLAETTDDVLFIEIGEPEIRGRAALESYVANLFKTVKVSQMTLVTDELTIKDSVASELGHYSETLEQTGKPPVHDAGLYLLNWKRESDGAWRMQRVMTHPRP